MDVGNPGPRGVRGTQGARKSRSKQDGIQSSIKGDAGVSKETVH